MDKIKMVVFDMAGTTVDEGNVVYQTLQKALQKAGFELTLADVLRDCAGKEKLQALRDVLAGGDVDEGQVQAIYADFLAMLDAAYQVYTVMPQPGAEALFQALQARGVKVVLNTGYGQATAKQLLTKLDWQEGRDIDLLVTASQVAAARPHPDMILLAMERLGITDPRTVAKVGDSVIDIQEGRNAGCGRVYGITTGAHSRAQLEAAGPDRVLTALGELLAE
jgi:phosphonatase-like hydrolase